MIKAATSPTKILETTKKLMASHPDLSALESRKFTCRSINGERLLGMHASLHEQTRPSTIRPTSRGPGGPFTQHIEAITCLSQTRSFTLEATTLLPNTTHLPAHPKIPLLPLIFTHHHRIIRSATSHQIPTKCPHLRPKPYHPYDPVTAKTPLSEPKWTPRMSGSLPTLSRQEHAPSKPSPESSPPKRQPARPSSPNTTSSSSKASTERCALRNGSTSSKTCEWRCTCGSSGY